MTRLRDRFPDVRPSTSRPRERAVETPPKGRQPKVIAPRNPSEPEDMARFVESLNGQLNQLTERLAQIESKGFDPEEFVRDDELEVRLNNINEEEDQLITSEGEDDVDPKSKRGRSSRKRKKFLEAAEAALQNAIPTVAPPNVGAASQLGTTISPVLFSLSDHTHGGVLGTPPAGGNSGEILFFTSSFEVDGESELFWHIANNFLGIGTAANPLERLHVMGSTAGTAVTSFTQHTDNTNTGSHARVRLETGGASGGDPFALFTVVGVTDWAVGIDNSDSDSFKLSKSTALGTTDSIVVDTSHNIKLTGKVQLYENIATAGKGLPPIVDAVALTAQTADIADTNLTNANVAGTYRVSVYAMTTTADAAAGDFTVNIKFTDNAAARTVTTGPVLLTATNMAQQTIFVRLNSGNITYGVTHTGAFGTAAYALYVDCERLT